jgi:hypothetical protein
MFKKIISKVKSMAMGAKVALANNKAEGFVDAGVSILINVIIGAVLLAGLYVLFGDTILPTLTTKVQGLFNYAG